MTEAYKTTGAGGACVFGRGVWTPGKWRTVSPPLVACRRGIHYCRRQDVVAWLNVELWLFEDGLPETALVCGDKMVTERGRIVERVEAWNETASRLFAADCAEAVLPIFERLRPDDERPRRAIEAARLYARGVIGAAARDAARDAARAATRDAARDAAWDAAAAAWAAARAAAWAAAWAAAGAAAGAAARDAARAATRDAARDAAWAAARAAAGDAQTEILFDYLGGRRT